MVRVWLSCSHLTKVQQVTLTVDFEHLHAEVCAKLATEPRHKLKPNRKVKNVAVEHVREGMNRVVIDHQSPLGLRFADRDDPAYRQQPAHDIGAYRRADRLR